MYNGRRFIGSIFALILAVLVSACGSSDSDVVQVISIGAPDDPFEKGIRLSPTGQLTRAATTEGLVAFDDRGRIIPALADRWIVTDDGLSYIFRLRDGTWVNGDRITASSARKALSGALKALRGTSLGLDLASVEDVRAMAGRVIEIRLKRPVPHFLQLLAQPELGLLHEGKGAGPMELEKKDEFVILAPIRPEQIGLPVEDDWDERTRSIRLQSLAAEQAVDTFNRGEADLVLNGRFANFPHSRSVGILRGTIQIDPVIGLFGLLVAHEDGFLAEPANREAIAMAIDREALLDDLGIDGWIATTRVVAPGLADDSGSIGERWSAMTLDDRRALARARIINWRDRKHGGQKASDEEGKGAVRLRIRFPKGPGADLVFARLRQDLTAVGFQVKRVGQKEPADLKLIESVARYPHATWFLNRLSCQVQKGPCDKGADAIVAAATRISDPAEYLDLIEQAEVELTQANVFIPFGAPIRWSLVRGSVSHFSANQFGWHPLMPLAQQPK